MAYDPNDPEDKKIVQKLINTALEEAKTEHESDIAGLKNKNKELVDKLKKANEGKLDAGEVQRLETELENTQNQLKEANKSLKKVTKDLEDASSKLGEETGYSKDLLVENDLNGVFAKVKVAPEFLPAAKALLKPQATIKEVEGKKSVYIGDKALEAYVTEWAQGAEGKVFISAPNNSGGGAPGGSRAGLNAESLSKLSPVERLNIAREQQQAKP